MPNNIRTTTNLIIANSIETQTTAQYARPSGNTARVSRWKVALFGGLLLIVLIPAFISLGMWQWRKAEVKTGLQTELDALSTRAAVPLPTAPTDVEWLRFRHVSLRGTYDASRQVLIDNRLHQERAGYHVITPLRLEGSEMHVLVNRGWLPAPDDHRFVPDAPVPTGTVELSGIAVVPGQRFFNLAPQPSTGWDPVWQNLDLGRFRQVVTYPLQSVVIQLDRDAPGGYVREWPRLDGQAGRNYGYALQWFGFAAASLGIWAYFLFRRP